MTTTETLTELGRRSAAIGRDLTLVQATGGNTSLKLGDQLWIKASGTALADATTRPVFVALDLPRVRAALQSGDGEGLSRFVIGQSGLRPSIETPLHALLPQTVVVHVHSVATLAWACRRDGQEALAPRLAGLRWSWIPYARPGEPLLQAIRACLPEQPEVLVLANHGLVVAGGDIDATFSLLQQVEERLGRPVLPTPPGDPAALADAAHATGYEPVSAPEVQAIALVAARQAMAEKGSLYPDHVVFLGAPGVWHKGCALTGSPSWLIVPGVGVLVKPQLTNAARDMLRCLGLVLERVDPEAPLTWLTADDEAELLGWDAEKYRQQLSAQPAV